MPKMFSSAVLLSALAAAALASPLVEGDRWPHHHAPKRDSTIAAGGASACAAVSASVASQSSATPSATPRVSAKLAYECITSVPLNVTAALELTKSIRPYIQWQSTTAWLKDPPAEYVKKIQDPVDVWGGLQKIENKVKSRGFANEYEFGWALYTLFQSTHDGHLVFVPDVIGEVFNFGRPLPLVSVSRDGKELPQPYVYPDILAQSFGNSTFTPSPIVKINGEKATKYLANWSQYGSLQDRDALYNNVFYELAVVSLGSSGSGMGSFAGGGRGRWVYPGPTTTLEFQNGTKIEFENFARVLIPFTGIDSGEALYRLRFTTPPEAAVNRIAASSTTAAPTSTAAPTPAPATSSAAATPAPGFPAPVIRHPQNLIGGYYLEGKGYDHIAVLSVPSFGAGAIIPQFQNIAERFLAAARAAGKTKLVIDVSANGGGLILQGYDLFKQLFPKAEPYAAADQFRAFEDTDLIGKKFSALTATIPRTLDWGNNETLQLLEEEVASSALSYQNDMTTDAKPFTSWRQKFGPVITEKDSYTNLFRWNFSDVLTPINSGGIYVTGYANRTNFTQPFDAKDIVVMTDGYCASTCTIFSELMRQVAGVKYISFGGRSTSGITQAIGGVKGTNNLGWDYIQFLVSIVYEFSTAAEQAFYDKTGLAKYSSTTLPFLRKSAGTAVNINFRDGIRKGDRSRTPLQFVYEPADCRIYWTPQMTVDISSAWKAAVDSAWGARGQSKCVAGDLGKGSSGHPHASGEVRSEESYGDGLVTRSVTASVEDYPMDLFTDLRGEKFDAGWMMP